MFVLPTPSKVHIKPIGSVLLRHWSTLTSQWVKENCHLDSGSAREFMQEFLCTVGRKYEGPIEDTQVAYDNAEKIDGSEKISDDEFNNIAEMYLKTEAKWLLPWLDEKDENYENLKKEREALSNRNEGESAQEHLRRVVKASIIREEEEDKRRLEEFSAIAKKFRDSLYSNSLAIHDLNSRIHDISSMRIPSIPKIENPIKESNARFDKLSTQLHKLTLLSEADIEQSKLLNDKTSELLMASAESTAQAKTSIYIATAAIIISALLSLWALVESKNSTNSTDAVLMEIAHESNVSSENLDRLKSILEDIRKNTYLLI